MLWHHKYHFHLALPQETLNFFARLDTGWYLAVIPFEVLVSLKYSPCRQNINFWVFFKSNLSNFKLCKKSNQVWKPKFYYKNHTSLFKYYKECFKYLLNFFLASIPSKLKQWIPLSLWTRPILSLNEHETQRSRYLPWHFNFTFCDFSFYTAKHLVAAKILYVLKPIVQEKLKTFTLKLKTL